MAYVKWVRNADPNDGTSAITRGEEVLLQLGQPVQLNKDDREKLEAQGLVFEDSSAEEHKEFEAQQGAVAASEVGRDVATAAPLFQDHKVYNQTSGVDQD